MLQDKFPFRMKCFISCYFFFLFFKFTDATTQAYSAATDDVYSYVVCLLLGAVCATVVEILR